MASTPAPCSLARAGSHCRENASAATNAASIHTATARDRPARLALLMAVGAIEPGLLHSMALHASPHRDIAFAGELGASGHRAMALFAFVAGGQVRAVAEVH